MTFTVEVQNANNPTYQWYRGTDPLADAVSPELTLTDVQTADSGSTFFAVVTSSSVSLTSAVATLTVTCSGLIYNGGFEVRGQTGSQNNALPLGWTEIEAGQQNLWVSSSGSGSRPNV